MGLNLEVQMHTNRTWGGIYPGRVRQGDRWVKAKLRQYRGHSLTAYLDRSRRWQVEVEGADGVTLVLEGTTGTNDVSISYQPKAEAAEAA